MVGNWYEDRLGTKPEAKSPKARPLENDIKVTRIKRKPEVDTGDRVVPKHMAPSYETVSRSTLQRHQHLKPLPSTKMMQFSNFEHMNTDRPLPNAPKYGFGAHFPVHKPQAKNLMSSTAHSSYGGKYAEKESGAPQRTERAKEARPISRSPKLSSTYSSSFNSSSPKRGFYR